MIRSVVKRLVVPLLVPSFFLLFAWWLRPYHNLLPRSLAGLMDYGPYWLLTVLAILGLTYNRGKLVLSSMLLILGLFLFNRQFNPQQFTMEQASLIDISLLGIIPFNLALISIYRERGVFTYHGAIRGAILLVQATIIIGIFYYPDLLPDLLSRQVRMQIMHYPVLAPVYHWYAPLAELPYTHAAQLLLFSGTVLLVTSAYYYNTYLSFGLLGAYIGYIGGVLFPGEVHLLAVNISAGSLLLCIALLRDSYNMAYRDELTGLSQRRALNEHLMSLGSGFTLAMLDVDHFKKFNDTHGHAVGDQVLQMVAQQIARVRGGGKAYRYGGEEFTVVFASKNISDAVYYLDEVRKSIQNYEMVIRDKARPKTMGKQNRSLRKRGSFRHTTKKVSVTISIGVACKEYRQERPEDVLKKADQALYKAKQAGRNQVTA